MDTYGHEQIYRGEELFKKLSSLRIMVCGCGAIGSNLIDNMVRQGFRDIAVIDHDRIEDHNRHTQVWGKRDIGQLKATMIQRKIFYDMGVNMKTIAKRLEPSNIKKFFSGIDLVIDGFDNSESRGLVSRYCRENKIECLHAGLYQDYGEVIWDESYRVPKDAAGLDVCEYPLARNIIMMVVSVATEVVIRWLEEGEKESYVLTLKDFKISKA